MKKILLLIAFFFVFTNLYSQGYLAFPDSNARWQIRSWVGPGYPYQYWYYYMNPVANDTTISSTTYAKLYMDSNYIGGVRHNNNGQVYFFPKDSLTEYLLFDYSKNVGDTIYNAYTTMFPGLYTLKVEFKDSALVANRYQRKIQASCLDAACVGGGMVTWIEGVGGYLGLLENTPILSVSGTPQLICMSHNDTTWTEGGFTLGNCSLMSGVGISEIEFENSFVISPNPATSELRIENAALRINNIEIYNAFGQKVYSVKQTKNSQPLTINIAGWNTGIYFVKVMEGEKMIVKKVIKM